VFADRQEKKEGKERSVVLIIVNMRIRL